MAIALFVQKKKKTKPLLEPLDKTERVSDAMSGKIISRHEQKRLPSWSDN